MNKQLLNPEDANPMSPKRIQLLAAGAALLVALLATGTLFYIISSRSSHAIPTSVTEAVTYPIY
ncbi:MAG TPA: hypothetical protein VMR98_02155, partial [Candidatus Polarisedimenticolaceae bacterium]|nr:hypothetical protein [Candidatus Polarisedimenticolaceae bacterium]